MTAGGTLSASISTASLAKVSLAKASPAVHVTSLPPSPSACDRLADGSAEQVPDAVGEGQAERSADDYSQHGAADVTPPQAGAEGTGQAESDQDRDEGDRYPSARPGQQDGQHRQQGAVGAQLDGDGAGGGRGQALGLVKGGQLGEFGLRGAGEFAFLLSYLGTLAVALAGDRHVFTQRHRHGAGDQ